MMRYFIFLCVLITPLFTSAEVINSFIADITVKLDGSVVVEETIEYDFEESMRHGIYRAIPTVFTLNEEERRLEIDIQEVTRNAQKEPYQVTSEEKPWRLRIGSPDKEISGVHEYSYTYTVRGAMRYFESFDELYWNLTGSEWGVPIRTWQAQVHAPRDEIDFLQSSCYQGLYGSNTPCEITQIASSSVSFQGSVLEPREEVTIAAALPKGQIEELVLYERNYWIYGLGLLIALVAYLGYHIRREVKKHDTRQAIVAQFEPYQKSSAVLSGYVLSGKLNAHLITAGLFELVRQGYITLTQKTKSGFFGDTTYYSIRYIEEGTAGLSDIHYKIVALFFDPSRNLKNQECNTSTYKVKAKDRQKLARALKEELSNQGWKESAPFSWKSLILSAVVLAVAWYLILPNVVALLAVTFWTTAIVAVALVAAGNRKTQEGYRAYYHTKGLERYISVAEEERVAFHDAPEKNPDTFTYYLPFAIAMSLEEQWVEQFKDMYVTQEGVYSEDGAPLNIANIAAISSMHTSVQSATPQPHSSSSGSGGGGFSGGGAGGGGGGSW